MNIIIFTISVIAGVMSVFPVILGSAYTKQGWTYMATGHYYLDYFVYVQAVAQGMRGNWAYINQFATDDRSKTLFVWWPYLILGKISSLLRMSPIIIYWFAVALIVFLTVFVAYMMIDRLLGKESFFLKVISLLFFIIAAPFVVISKSVQGILIYPYTYWYSPHDFFQRFERVPHHLLGTLLIILTIMIVAKYLDSEKKISVKEAVKKGVMLAVIPIVTLTFYPYNVLNFIIALVLSTMAVLIIKSRIQLKKHSLIFLLTFFCFVLPASIAIRLLVGHVGLLERLNLLDLKYIHYPSLMIVFMTTGPIILFSFAGLYDFFRRPTWLKIIVSLLVIVSFIFSFSQVSLVFNNFNLRFLSPISYLLFGVTAVLGIKRIARIFVKHELSVTYGIIFFLLAYFLYVNYLGFQNVMADRNYFSPITYLPTKIIDGYRQIDRLEGKGAVLTSPSQFLGTVLPLYTKKTMYIARHAFTPNYEEKALLADRFYTGKMNQEEAKGFLSKNTIEFVVLSSIEGYSFDLLINTYPFLQTVYRNGDLIILKPTP